MKNYDQSVKINNNPNWTYIPDHLYRILIIGVSGTGKTNGFLNLIRNQIMTKFTYMLKDPFASKCQLFINAEEKVGIKKLKNSRAFIDSS